MCGSGFDHTFHLWTTAAPLDLTAHSATTSRLFRSTLYVSCAPFFIVTALPRRYEKGDQFGQHVDVSTKGAEGEETEFTLLIYLNGSETQAELTESGQEALQGGETIFWKTKTKQLVSIAPKRGMALFHAHGRRCLMHEGAEVLKGQKYMLRSDVMYRRLSPEEQLSYDAESRAILMEADSALAHWRPKELAALIAPVMGIDAGKKPKEVVEEAARKLGLDIDMSNSDSRAGPAVAAEAKSRSSGANGGAGWVRTAALRVVAALKLEPELAGKEGLQPAAPPLH